MAAYIAKELPRQTACCAAAVPNGCDHLEHLAATDRAGGNLENNGSMLAIDPTQDTSGSDRPRRGSRRRTKKSWPSTGLPQKLRATARARMLASSRRTRQAHIFVLPGKCTCAVNLAEPQSLGRASAESAAQVTRARPLRYPWSIVQRMEKNPYNLATRLSGKCQT